MKERVEKEVNHDSYDIDVEIKRTELYIKEYERKNNEIKRTNKALIRYNQKLHAVSHHRVTLDDDS